MDWSIRRRAAVGPGDARSDLRARSTRRWPSERAEIKAITSNAEPPTFENTIEALERSGQARNRVSGYSLL